MKSEPDVFSLQDLMKLPDRTSGWDGVRNYQARNFMWKEMSPGDPVLFYHSNCEVPGIAGLAEVASEPIPDPTAWDPKSEYHDPKSSPDNPRWWMVKVKGVEVFSTFLPLSWIREQKSLEDMLLLRKGQRLSVQPVTKTHFNRLLNAGRRKPKS